MSALGTPGTTGTIGGAGSGVVAAVVAAFFETSLLNAGPDHGATHPPWTSAIAQPMTTRIELARVNCMRVVRLRRFHRQRAPPAKGPDSRKNYTCWQAQRRVDPASRAASA